MTIVAVSGCGQGDRQVAVTSDTAIRPDTSRVDDPALPTFGAADTAQRGAVVEYASRARFVTDHHMTDEQALLFRGARGPTVRVEAVSNAHRLSPEQLGRGALIGRFVSGGEYQPLGLRRGINYVFVDSSRGWRAVIVPAEAAQPVKVMQMAMLATSHLIHIPTARFFELGGMTFGNLKCGKICCVPCDPPGYICPPAPRLDAMIPEEIPQTQQIPTK